MEGVRRRCTLALMRDRRGHGGGERGVATMRGFGRKPRSPSITLISLFAGDPPVLRLEGLGNTVAYKPAGAAPPHHGKRPCVPPLQRTHLRRILAPQPMHPRLQAGAVMWGRRSNLIGATHPREAP
jgi:hypothetical protein